MLTLLEVLAKDFDVSLLDLTLNIVDEPIRRCGRPISKELLNYLHQGEIYGGLRLITVEEIIGFLEWIPDIVQSIDARGQGLSMLTIQYRSPRCSAWLRVTTVERRVMTTNLQQKGWATHEHSGVFGEAHALWMERS